MRLKEVKDETGNPVAWVGWGDDVPPGNQWIVDKEGHVLEKRTEPPQMAEWRLESRTTWVADGRLWESVIRSKEAK